MNLTRHSRQNFFGAAMRHVPPMVKRTKTKDRLDGFREEDSESVDLLPEEYEELDVLGAAFGTIAELKDIGSPLRKVLDQARADAREAVRVLVQDTNPMDGNRVRELQWAAQRFDALVFYVKKTLQEGEVALESKTAEQAHALEQAFSEDMARN